MNELLVIACGSGLQDGLNPCMFMTCAVFIAHGLWFKRSPIVWPRIIFVLAYGLSTLVFNFGPAQIFIFQKNFLLTAKIFYFILSIWAFISGVLFCKDWYLIYRGQTAKNTDDEKPRLFAGNPFVRYLATIILGVGSSALATFWPINNYMMILGNEAILKGQWQTVMPLLGTYIFISMWPLWLVWAFLSMKDLPASLLKIFCASVFLTASSMIIFVFKG